MIVVYHFVLGLITLFAILHTPDVKKLLGMLIAKAKEDSCGEAISRVINYTHDWWFSLPVAGCLATVCADLDDCTVYQKGGR